MASKKTYYKKQIKKLTKQIREADEIEKKHLRGQKKLYTKLVSTKKRKKYTYKSKETRERAIARGKALKSAISSERRQEIETKRQESLMRYRAAQKIAKEDETYRRYWEEVKKLRKQAKKIGVKLGLENITGSPMQLKDVPYSPEEQSRFALGLATKIDVENLLQKAIEAGVIGTVEDNNGVVIGYTYDSKGYTPEEIKFMLSSPRKFFQPNSIFWLWIEEEFHANGGGKSGKEAVASEIFGS